MFEIKVYRMSLKVGYTLLKISELEYIVIITHQTEMKIENKVR